METGRSAQVVRANTSEISRSGLVNGCMVVYECSGEYNAIKYDTACVQS